MYPPHPNFIVGCMTERPSQERYQALMADLETQLARLEILSEMEATPLVDWLRVRVAEWNASEEAFVNAHRASEDSVSGEDSASESDDSEVV